MTQFNSGYRADLENLPRLLATGQRFACTAGEIPDEVDARPWVTTENQGNVGSCYGHAASTVGEHCNYVQSGGDKTQLSRMFCYLMGQKAAGLFGSDQGCHIAPGIDSLKGDGFAKEATFPYPGRYVLHIPDEAVAEGKQHRMGSHTVHRSLDEMVQFAGRGVGGTIAGIPWYESFANNNTGLIDSLGGAFYGWHAVAFIGYDREKRPRLFNSHGTGWGDNGSAVIARDVMEQLFNTDGAIFIGVSDMQAFSDRKIPDWGRLYG